MQLDHFVGKYNGQLITISLVTITITKLPYKKISLTKNFPPMDAINHNYLKY